MATPIGTLGTIPTITVGGRVFTDLTTLIILGTWGASGGANSTMRLGTGSSGYQVTAAKTLTISALRACANGTTERVQLAQTDNDVGFNSATALTNPVYYMGSSSVRMLQIPASVGTFVESSFKFNVAATKYVTVITGAADNTVTYAYGYEA